MTSSNMYRVGDFVYFEVSASSPYQIRKIEELNKTSTGAVEAKVVCFYRRRDLSLNLIQLADKHQELSTPADKSEPEWLHQVRNRELFLSRHLETLPATHIRGKCSVTLHNDSEPYDAYLSKEDAFFFQLVYDPVQKTLQADHGSIREGSQYQADVGPYEAPEDNVMENAKPREELRWRPDHGLSAADLDNYLLLSRSLAVLGRAYHTPTALRQPNLTMSAAAAARDSTHQHALDLLHSADYKTADALQLLAPNQQPVLVLDEMEQWSASEGNLFEEALEKYGKCFYDIQSDFLPWKHPKSLIEFYYMWKTTDHYMQQKRFKAVEAEHHLKQVYIPNYNKPNPAVLYPPPICTVDPSSVSRGCDGCANQTSVQWYALGPATNPLKVCADCWTYWKRYGDLKAISILDKIDESTVSQSNGSSDLCLDQHVVNLKTDGPGALTIGGGSPSNVSSPKPESNQVGDKPRPGVGFQFCITPALRVARRVHSQCRLYKQGRHPFRRVDASFSVLLAHATSISPAQVVSELRRLHERTVLLRSMSITEHADRLLAILTRIFPNRPIPAKSNSEPAVAINPEISSNVLPSRSMDKPTGNGLLDPAPLNIRKRQASSLPSEVPYPTKKSTADSTMQSVGVFSATGPKRRIGMDTESGHVVTLLFQATTNSKMNRRKLFTTSELRRLGRHPWRDKDLTGVVSVKQATTQSSSPSNHHVDTDVTTS